MSTKLTLEINYPSDTGDDIETVVVTKNRWDLNVQEMCEMFTRLMKGAGFQVRYIEEVDLEN